MAATTRYRVAFVILIAALAAVFFIGRWCYGESVDAVIATRSDIVQTIVASGRVETPLRVDIGSQLTGKVVAIPVGEGQAVKAGQLLIELESSEFAAAVAQARAAVNQARMRLTQLQQVGLPTAQQGLHQTHINVQNLERQYRRTKELFAQGFVGQSQLDDAQQKLDLARSQLRSAELQVSTNEPGGADVLMAQAALDQARANLRMAEAKLGYTRIVSPSNGVLIARDVERGDVVQPGKALMVLSPAGKTQLVVQIDEKNLSYLKLGQTALGSADAFPDRTFPAQLVYINPAVDPQRGSVEVKLDVRDTPDYLRQDMTVSVDIEVARKGAAVIAPVSTVHDNGAAPWVMKVVAGHARRQTVVLGLRGRGKVEFVKGVESGDALIPAMAKIDDGGRVHVNRQSRESNR